MRKKDTFQSRVFQLEWGRGWYTNGSVEDPIIIQRHHRLKKTHENGILWHKTSGPMGVTWGPQERKKVRSRQKKVEKHSFRHGTRKLEIQDWEIQAKFYCFVCFIFVPYPMVFTDHSWLGTQELLLEVLRPVVVSEILKRVTANTTTCEVNV